MAPELEEARRTKTLNTKRKAPKPIRRILLALEQEGAKSAVKSIEEVLSSAFEDHAT
jgi:hypothetical protein